MFTSTPFGGRHPGGPDQDKQHDTKGEQGSPSIADEGQGDPNYGRQPYRHTNVDDYMEEKHAGYTIGITSAKYASLSFGDRHDPHQQEDINTQEDHASEETKALPDRTEDEVRFLLGYEVIACLGSF